MIGVGFCPRRVHLLAACLFRSNAVARQHCLDLLCWSSSCPLSALSGMSGPSYAYSLLEFFSEAMGCIGSVTILVSLGRDSQ